MKIILAIVIGLCGLVWFIFNQSNTMDEIHILPKDFIGVVMIIHDQKDGVDVHMENGNIIYRIPPNGILKTKAPLVAGLKEIKYYYETNGNRRELKYCWDFNQLSTDTVKVYGGSTGTNGLGEDAVDYTTYIVSTKKEADSLSKVLAKMYPLEILKQQ
jgi:hypothetical protein